MTTPIPLIGPDGRRYKMDDPANIEAAAKLGYRVETKDTPQTAAEKARGWVAEAGEEVDGWEADQYGIILGVGVGVPLAAWAIYAFVRFAALRFVKTQTAALMACCCASSIAVFSGGVFGLAVPVALFLLYRDLKKVPEVKP